MKPLSFAFWSLIGISGSLLNFGLAEAAEIVQPKKSESLVYVMRPKGTSGPAKEIEILSITGSAKSPKSKSITKISDGTYQVLNIKPGNHQWVRADVWAAKKETVSVDPAYGKVVFYLLGPTDKGTQAEKLKEAGTPFVVPLFRNGFIEIDSAAATQILPSLTRATRTP